MKDSAPELNVSSSETEEDKEEAKPDGEKDPDFNQVCVKLLFIVLPSAVLKAASPGPQTWNVCPQLPLFALFP